VKTITIILSCICLTISAQEIKTAKIYETETYKNRIKIFQKEGLEKNSIIFLGNSLTQGGDWSAWFPAQKPANRGISGDNTEGVLARLDEITEAKPAKLFLMIGINDISQNYKNDYLCKNFEKIIRKVLTESPETTIYIQSILPVNNDFGRYKKLINKEKQIETLNIRLNKLCIKENIRYVNLYPLFLQQKRKLNPAYTTDGLHLNNEGYQVWINGISSLIEE
jgi:lysophospholipase L1-like esterase